MKTKLILLLLASFITVGCAVLEKTSTLDQGQDLGSNLVKDEKEINAILEANYGNILYPEDVSKIEERWANKMSGINFAAKIDEFIPKEEVFSKTGLSSQIVKGVLTKRLAISNCYLTLGKCKSKTTKTQYYTTFNNGVWHTTYNYRGRTDYKIWTIYDKYGVTLYEWKEGVGWRLKHLHGDKAPYRKTKVIRIDPTTAN